MARRRTALLVSMSIYDDPAFRQLQSPAADIAALSGILEDPQLGGYEVQLLSDAPSYQVNQAVEGFFAGARRDDSVLLYFSGHGFRDDANRLFIVTRDSRSTLLGSTAVSAQFVRDQLERCRSRRKIVILDCCYAGAFPAGATKDAGKVDVLGEFGGHGSVVIAASSALQYAFESSGEEAISEVNGRLKPSVFTSALIEGIATGSADLNGDGIIDVDELYSHVHEQVTIRVPQQTPQKKSDVEGTLFVARSPLGPRPSLLESEILQALRNPLPSVRLAVIKDLVESCSEAPHLGVVLAVQNALRELTQDDSKKVARAADEAIKQISLLAAEVMPLAAEAIAANANTGHGRDQDPSRRSSRYGNGNATGDLIAEAQRAAEAILATARRNADEMRSQARRILEESEAQRAQAEAEFEILLAARRQEAERLEAERLAAAQAATQKLVSEAMQRASTAEQRAAQADQVRRDADTYARQLINNAKRDADQIVAQARAHSSEAKNEPGLRRLARRKDRTGDIWPDDGISDEDYWASVAADRPLPGSS